MAGFAILALNVTALAAAIGVGLFFLLAGVGQWRHRALLPGVIANYRLLPRRLIAPVAMALPVTEMVIGIALIIGIAPLPVLLAMVLLVLFAVAMAINIARGRSHIDCGCGHGALRHPIGWGLVIRNLLLAVLIAPRLFPGQAMGMMDVATAIGGGVAIALLCLLFQSIGALAASPAHRR